jgi:N-acetylglucosaminyldiphosphoundecaprenol N-acetyl-beta-D-mannosaminyltransferase
MLTLSDDSQSQTVSLLGVPFRAITEEETCLWIADALMQKVGGTVVTANLDYLRRCQVDDRFSRFVKNADLIVADGMPLIWASSLQGTPLPGRVAGSSLCLTLAHQLARAKHSIFLLGGNPGVAEKAADILVEKNPGLRIAGIVCPEFGFEKDPNRIQEIREQLIEAKPDVVYVALGSPKTEHLIAELQASLPHTWWIGIGISLSFITGDVQRAPQWMQRMGVEWIHRLYQEPGRLAKRYLLDGVPFAIQLLAGSAWKGMRGKAESEEAREVDG